MRTLAFLSSKSLVRTCLGTYVYACACVRVTVLRRCLELLRWKLVAQWPWRGDDSEQSGLRGLIVVVV